MPIPQYPAKGRFQPAPIQSICLRGTRRHRAGFAKGRNGAVRGTGGAGEQGRMAGGSKAHLPLARIARLYDGVARHAFFAIGQQFHLDPEPNYCCVNGHDFAPKRRMPGCARLDENVFELTRTDPCVAWRFLFLRYLSVFHLKFCRLSAVSCERQIKSLTFLLQSRRFCFLGRAI